MSSAISPVRATLDAYLAGRARAEQVVAVVAEVYYGEGGRAGDGLRPLVEVIERTAPGAVELARIDGRAGFAIRPGARPFPREQEPALRAAAAAVLRTWGAREQEGAPASRGVLAGLIRALQRLFR